MAGTAQDLAAAVRALVPTSVTIAAQTVTATVYDTEADKTPPNIYYVVNVRIPNPAQRSEAGHAASMLCRVLVTVGARTAVAVRDMASAVAGELDTVKPVAAGWETGPLLLRNTRGPDVDDDVTFTGGAQVVYGLLEFDLLASRLLP